MAIIVLSFFQALMKIQTESIGTVRLNQAAVPVDEDEFMSSDEGEETDGG